MNQPFIDSHVHFWDRRVLPYRWLTTVPAIAGAHTPVELNEEAPGVFPEKCVFVQCGAPMMDEVRWIEKLAAAEPRIAAIVAGAPMDAGRVTTEAIAALQNHPLVRGVRHLIQDEADPAFCIRPEFIAGVRQLGSAGFSFDLCCRHHQLPAVIQLVRSCPDTRFILDHAGKPDLRSGLLDPWRAQIEQLAALPNVDCKFSGLVTEADPLTWTVADLQPCISHLLATFGPSRLLFGGDWPVVKLASSYMRWLDAAQQLVSALSAPELSAVFHDNARRVYQLP